MHAGAEPVTIIKDTYKTACCDYAKAVVIHTYKYSCGLRLSTFC